MRVKGKLLLEVWGMRWLPVVILSFSLLFPGEARAAQPNFHLFDQTGKMISLTEFHGRPVAILFWADWCKGCRSSLEALARVERPGVTLLAVDESVSEANPDAVRREVQALHLDIPVLFDELGEAAEVLGVTSLPTLVLLSPTHAVILRRAGPFDPEEYGQLLDEFPT